MVKSGSNDFGGWILKLLRFQSSVSYLRDESHQPNHCRYWQCFCLVSALFWGRGDLTHEVDANTFQWRSVYFSLNLMNLKLTPENYNCNSTV